MTKPESEREKAISDLVDTAKEAADYLAELYAKYSLKIGPFASQAQRLNGALQAAIRAVEPSGQLPKQEA